MYLSLLAEQSDHFRSRPRGRGDAGPVPRMKGAPVVEWLVIGGHPILVQDRWNSASIKVSKP